MAPCRSTKRTRPAPRFGAVRRAILSFLAELAGLVPIAASATIISTTGTVEEIAPPASAVLGALESDTQIRAFDEVQNLVLPADLAVDIDFFGAADGLIPAGTRVSSHLVHMDSIGGNQVFFLDGRVKFDGAIIAIIWSDERLNSTDPLFGVPGTLYPTGQFDRNANIPDDFILQDLAFDPSGMTAVVHFGTDVYMDEARVLTVPAIAEPHWSFGALLASVVTLVALRRRNRALKSRYSPRGS